MLKNTKLDYFALWGNSKQYEDEIIEKIEKLFFIKRIVRRKFNIFSFIINLYFLYWHSFVPFYFLFKKSFYLRKFPKEILFIFIENRNPVYIHEWNGVFRTLYCKNIHEIKTDIRNKFQTLYKNEHMIHSGDTYYDYMMAKKISKDKNTKFDVDLYKKKYLNFDNLYCLQNIGTRWDYKNKIIPLSQSVHLKYLKGNKSEYLKYIKIFRGTAHKNLYSILRFDSLLRLIQNQEKISNILIAKKINNKYIILDGLHRSSIYYYLGIKKKQFYIYE